MQEKTYSVKIELTLEENKKFKAVYQEIVKSNHIEFAGSIALNKIKEKIDDPEKYKYETIAIKRISYIPKLKQLKMQL